MDMFKLFTSAAARAAGIGLAISIVILGGFYLINKGVTAKTNIQDAINKRMETVSEVPPLDGGAKDIEHHKFDAMPIGVPLDVNFHHDINEADASNN